MNPQFLIQGLINNNPNFRNNPMLQNVLNMVNRNDAQGIQRIAENLCRERGVSVDDAIRQARKFFNV